MTQTNIDAEVVGKVSRANEVKSETVSTCDELISLLATMNSSHKELVTVLRSYMGPLEEVTKAIKAEEAPKVAAPAPKAPVAAALEVKVTKVPAAKASAPKAKTGELSRLRAGRPPALSILLQTIGNAPRKEGRAKDLADACAAVGGPSAQYIAMLFSQHKELFEKQSRGLYGLSAEGRAELRKLTRHAAPEEPEAPQATGTIPETVLRRRPNPAAVQAVASHPTMESHDTESDRETGDDHDSVELSAVFQGGSEPAFQANPFQMV